MNCEIAARVVAKQNVVFWVRVATSTTTANCSAFLFNALSFRSHALSTAKLLIAIDPPHSALKSARITGNRPARSHGFVVDARDQLLEPIFILRDKIRENYLSMLKVSEASTKAQFVPVSCWIVVLPQRQCQRIVNRKIRMHRMVWIRCERYQRGQGNSLQIVRLCLIRTVNKNRTKGM
jgi:hypothetical protein